MDHHYMLLLSLSKKTLLQIMNVNKMFTCQCIYRNIAASMVGFIKSGIRAYLGFYNQAKLKQITGIFKNLDHNQDNSMHVNILIGNRKALMYLAHQCVDVLVCNKIKVCKVRTQTLETWKNTFSSLKGSSLIDFQVVRFIDIEYQGKRQKYCHW